MQIEELRRLETVGRLAGGLAHDFNNLLTAITGYTELLITRLSPEHPGLQDAYEVRRAALCAARLTRHLLAISRGRPGRKEAIDVNIVVSRTVGILRSTLGDDIVLSVELDPQLKCVEADAAHLEQVVLNLAMNARDSMPDGGRLAIRTHMRPAADNGVGGTAGDDVCLDVSDTGCGIPLDLQSRIFEPFFTTKGGLGTGLGLATVHDLVAENHGVIAVDSAVGRGTTFSIAFPATRGSAVPEGVETPLFIEGCATILVVEDDPGIRALTELVLRRAGHEVLLAAGPQDALAAIRRPATVNLVVTDVMMPGMNGYALAGEMRRIRPGLKCVFMSGCADDRRLGQTSDTFVAKPFTAEVLTLAVRRAIAA